MKVLVIGLMKGRSVLVFVQIPWQRCVVKCLIEAQNKMEKKLRQRERQEVARTGSVQIRRI